MEEANTFNLPLVKIGARGGKQPTAEACIPLGPARHTCWLLLPYSFLSESCTIKRWALGTKRLVQSSAAYYTLITFASRLEAAYILIRWEGYWWGSTSTFWWVWDLVFVSTGPRANYLRHWVATELPESLDKPSTEFLWEDFLFKLRDIDLVFCIIWPYMLTYHKCYENWTYNFSTTNHFEHPATSKYP